MKTEFFTAKTSADTSYKTMALARRGALAYIGAASILLSACAHQPLALPSTPGSGVISTTHLPDGFVITSAKHDYLISKGVPAAWFISYTDGHFWIDSEREGYAADILLKDRNP